MHAHADMTTTTISLERSAYELLKSRKKPEESFSEELHRLLGGSGPRLTEFLAILSADDGQEVAAAVEQLRAEDRALERRHATRGGSNRGRRR
jgi:predicted CopG family antitoxin